MTEEHRVDSVPQEEIIQALRSRYQFLGFWASSDPILGINIYVDIAHYTESEVNEIREFIHDFYTARGIGFEIDVEHPIKDPGILIYHVINMELIYSGDY